ncbi:MAG: PEGA domain-containing protein [Parcubacteria group bacterium]|nr:PEGA domain-containing protein [Parcubacteria group bacterium]MCR4342842.1 PEGA domain-containing protein [Patescibacteria group bacterium]
MLISFLVFIILVPIIILYTSGYRIDKNLHIRKTGGLYISSPLSGAKILVNEKNKGETSLLQGGIFLQNLTPNTYSVIVAKDGFWPWAKKLEVKEGLVTEARAILIPTDPQGEILLNDISKKDENFPAKENEILARLLKPTSEPIAKVDKNKDEKIFVDEADNLWIEWLPENSPLPYYFCNNQECKSPLLVLASRFPIRKADFYPSRSDVLIIAVQNAIYAIEVDGRDGRLLLQPIYKGANPVFELENKTLYILDEKTFIKINL